MLNDPLVQSQVRNRQAKSRLTLTGEIKVLALSGEHKTAKLLDIKSTGAGGALSPDSKWLAYVSAESGTPQGIYVVPFRSASDDAALGQGKWQITSGGSVAPSWRGDRKEMYFSSNSFIGIASVPLTG